MSRALKNQAGAEGRAEQRPSQAQFNADTLAGAVMEQGGSDDLPQYAPRPEHLLHTP